MATLFNTKISATYEGLLKTIDNAAISATLKELTDGSGNQSGLYLNTAGDFKVTNVLEWGSLKDTGTGVTINRYVTSTDGLENFDNNTSLPTSAAVKLYVDTKFATSDTLQEVLSFGNTTSGNNIVVSASDDITFTDSSKALFGSSQDLEINHNGTDSFVTDLGTGDLRLRSDNSIKIQASTGGNNLATFTKGAGVDLYFNNAKKLETTNTGVSVTGIISNLTNPIDAQDAATKSYVDGLDAGSDLDITDGTNTGDVNLNTQTLSILGTTNEIETVVSGQSVTIGLPSSISTDLVGNVTGNLTGNVAGDLTGNVTSTSVLANGVTATTQASTDSSTKVATTAYVKGLDNASDLDFSGDSGTGDVNLNAQTFAITGTANQIESSASNQGLSLQFPSAGVTLPNGSLATTQSADDNSTKVATTSYVDTSAALYLPLVGGTMSGNTIHNDSIKSIYGTGSDAQVYHDGSNFYANNSTGQLNIDQSAVTESIVFKTSDANALDTTALIINRGGDLITGRDVTIAGDLTVNGTTTTVNSQTLSVDDPLISLAINNAANSLDIGYYGKYNDGTTRYLGLYNDASDSNKFKLFKGTTVEPTTTVNIGAAGYAAADLELANLVATGNVTGTTFLGDLNGTINTATTAATQSAGDNSTKVATTAYVDTSAGLYLPLAGGTLTGPLTGTSATFAGEITASKNQNATSTFTFQNTDTTNTNSRTNLNVTAGNRFINLLAINDDHLYLNRTSATNLYIQRGSATDVIIDSSGNVGIGTDSPDKTLTVGGTSTTHGIDIKTKVGATVYKLWEAEQYFSDEGYQGIYYGNVKKIQFRANGDSYFVGGNVGIGTDSPDADLDVHSSVNISNPTSTINEVADLNLRTTSSNWGYRQTKISSTLLNTTTGSNRLDFTIADGSISGGDIVAMSILSAGGNVGIGTTSPDSSLTLGNDTANIAELRVLRSNGLSGTYAYVNTVGGTSQFGGTGDTRLRADGSSNLLFATNSAERMRIASDGTVDIYSGGGTSEKTYTATAGLQLYSQQSDASSPYTKTSDIVANGDGTVPSELRMFTKASGSSTPTERMRITSGGEVLINAISRLNGYTSGFKTLNISAESGDNASIIELAGNRNAAAGNQNAMIQFWNKTSTAAEVSRISSVQGSVVNSGDIQFSTSNAGTLAERMRITSTGTVQVGATAGYTTINQGAFFTKGGGDMYTANLLAGASVTPMFKLQRNDVEKYNIGLDGNDNLAFINASGDAKVSITSGGEVGFGTSSDTVINGSVYIKAVDAANTVIKVGHKTGSVSGSDFTAFYYNNVQIGGVAQSGTTGVSFNTSSDYRLKEDLKDFAGLDMVSKIPVYDYKWKADESRSYGVMAHELQEVLPQAVVGEKDAEEMQGVDYSKIVPLLIKSIQELTAKVERLEAK